MVYILNKTFSPNKKCTIALSKIFGLGFPLIYQICDQLGLSPQLQLKQLNTAQLDRLTRCVSQNYMIEMDLLEIIKKNKERFIATSAYRGFRYIEGLPCRGQRTHGNAQSARRCGPKFVSMRTPRQSETKWKRRRGNR